MIGGIIDKLEEYAPKTFDIWAYYGIIGYNYGKYRRSICRNQ